MTAMHNPTSRLRRFVSALTAGSPAGDEQVHFHRGPQGVPAVCDNPRCASPRLEL